MTGGTGPAAGVEAVPAYMSTGAVVFGKRTWSKPVNVSPLVNARLWRRWCARWEGVQC